MMKYKGYMATVEYDGEGRCFHGRVIDIADTVYFKGTSVKELERAFRDALDAYLAHCADIGKSPDKPYSGRFNVRLNPALHRQVATLAQSRGKSLNTFVAEALQRAVHK
jgi:predicted HicB family RNase H-like nuclease